jgi:hypothetical protein
MSLSNSVSCASAEGSFVKYVNYKTTPVIKHYYTALIEGDCRPKETNFYDMKGERIA